jgi:hypothetical protein
MAENKICGARVYEVKLTRHGTTWLILAPDAARAEMIGLVLHRRDVGEDDELVAADRVDCVGTLDAVDKAYLPAPREDAAE